MNNLNLLYITDEVLQNNNAPTIHIVEICNSLNKQGYNVEIIAPSISTYTTKNFNIKLIPMTKVFRSGIFHPLLAISLLRILSTQNKNVIYLRYFPLLTIVILIAKIYSVPVILEVNGNLVLETLHTKNNYINRIKALLYKSLDLINFKLATKIIAVTHGLKEYVESYNIDPHKIDIIGNGININFFKIINNQDARKKINLENHKIYVGYIGSLYTYQGINYIINSAKEITKKNNKVEFIIVGNGPEEERIKLKKQITQLGLQNKIKLIGPIPHNEVIYYLNAFDICICYPSRFRDNITSPFKLFEYLASKKAVISSDIAGIKEQFLDTIFYAKPENTTDLTNKITYLIENPNVRKTLGEKGFKLMKKNTWEHVSNRINTVIQEILN